MFISNLGECEKSFYLGECDKCNYCTLSNEQDYLIYLIDKKEQDLSDLLNYIDIKELKQDLIDIIFLKQKIQLISKELDKIINND